MKIFFPVKKITFVPTIFSSCGISSYASSITTYKQWMRWGTCVVVAQLNFFIVSFLFLNNKNKQFTIFPRWFSIASWPIGTSTITWTIKKKNPQDKCICSPLKMLRKKTTLIKVLFHSVGRAKVVADSTNYSKGPFSLQWSALTTDCHHTIVSSTIHASSVRLDTKLQPSNAWIRAEQERKYFMSL